MSPETMILTPHGEAANAAASALIGRVMDALSRRKLLPVEAIAHYVGGAYGRGEGWVALEGKTWVPYGTPELVILLPEEFEHEALLAQDAIDHALSAVCIEAGYSASVRVDTPVTLRRVDRRRAAYELQHGRKLLWSLDGHDPFDREPAIDPDALRHHGLLTLLEQGPRRQDLSRLREHAPAAFQPGLVRLVFIRALEVLTEVGNAVLLAEGAFRAPLAERAVAMRRLAESGVLKSELAALYGAAAALQSRMPTPKIPPWADLRTLGHEVEFWAGHVAVAHFEAHALEAAS